MILYNYIFYRIFLATNLTNKSIPEWSTIITMSVLILINGFTFASFFGIDLKTIPYFYYKYPPFILIGINWFLFIRKNRYIEIVEKFKSVTNKTNLFHDVLIHSYAMVSTYFFLGLVDVQPSHILLIIAVLTIYPLYIYFNKDADSK